MPLLAMIFLKFYFTFAMCHCWGIITGPGGRLTMLYGVWRRLSLSSATLHGGPVEFRPSRATPCFRNISGTMS